MIRVFQNIRKVLIAKRKFGKYLSYAIGEIVLITLGIIGGIQGNDYIEFRNNEKLKNKYITSLIRDLSNDSIQLDKSIVVQKRVLASLNSIQNRIYDQNANIDTLKKIARFEYPTGNALVNIYNTNTFDELIATGNIELLERDIIEALMELNRLQLIEKDATAVNRNLYFSRLNEYAGVFSYYGLNHPKDNPIENFLWEDIDDHDFTPKFTSLVRSKEWGTKRYIDLSSTNKIKTENLISKLRQYLE